MKDKQAYSFDLDAVQHDFLQQMTEKYSLPDISKTIRCLINYARAEAGERDAIFQDVRCLDC